MINTLKNYLNIFQDKGIHCTHGENVVIAKKELMTVCTHLQKMSSLPDEALLDILEG